MLLLVWSPVLTSTAEVFRGSCTQSFIGLMCQKEFSTNFRVTMYSCLHSQSPRYLADLCVPVSNVLARQHLRSTTRHLLVVPRCRLSTLGPRAFSMAGPSLWNSLPDSLRGPDLGWDNFRRLLKTHLFTLCI